jgi:hypothetical protein
MNIWANLMGVAIMLASGGFRAPQKNDQQFICSRNDVPVVLADASDVATFTNLSVSTGAYSVGEVTFENRSRKPVVNLIMVVRYLDETKETILNMTFEASTPSVFPPGVTLVRSRLDHRWVRPIAPARKARLLTRTDSTTGICASGAAIIYLYIRYSDASEYTWTSPGWRSDAFIQDAPQYFVSSHQVAEFPRDLTVAVQIDARGKIQESRIMGETPLWLKSEIESYLKGLSLYPAIGETGPVQSNQVWLFRFHRQGENWMSSPTEIPADLTIMDFIAQESEVGRWVVRCGGRPASAFLPVKDN